MFRVTVLFFILFCCIACGSTKNTLQQNIKPQLYNLPEDAALTNAHVGIAVYDLHKQTYIVKHQIDKYFTPASNTKLFTTYAALKMIGDSIATANIDNNIITPLADPSFLSRDFKTHPLLEYLEKHDNTFINLSLNKQFSAYGAGWTVDDIDAQFMVERSQMPVFQNYINIVSKRKRFETRPWLFRRYIAEGYNTYNPVSSIMYEPKDSNAFYKFILSKDDKEYNYEMPFPIKENNTLLVNILKDTAKINNISIVNTPMRKANLLYSQKRDSVLKYMMHRSDNFYAEQLLLNGAIKVLDTMNEQAAINYIKRTYLAHFKQDPIWVDGSGMSRYNMFTPENFIELLIKLHDDIGMNVLKTILPTGGSGTLSKFYKEINNKIFAKTGTLTGQSGLSGYLYGKSGKLYAFSILANNYKGGATDVRKAFEKFVLSVYNNY
jgi:serine-type D-Ala-D-Ala carboxypeptidase/endopeptidase (penicillin-binding protein 4)